MPVLGDPSWTWQKADTTVLTQAFAVGSVGVLLTVILLGASAHEHFRRLEGDGKETDTEKSLLLDKVAPDAWWRIIYLVFVGMSPLISCILVGESLGNVLFAMVVMHWIAMLVFPALYYTIRSHGDDGFASAALIFYRDLRDRHLVKACRKALRGCAIGAPIFLCFFLGYGAFRCKTFGSPVCVRNFERPLEDYGFSMHSMSFRILAGLYFTFWNPVIEELFWRVFLHREISSELGLKTVESSEMDDAPWHHLWRDIVQVSPSWPFVDFTTYPRVEFVLNDGISWSAARARWGVCFMYASYHTWPMKVLFLFNNVWWLHILGGFLFLSVLGRFFLVLRENPNFGLPAAYAVHAWVDAAFAVLCLFETQYLFEIKPEEVLGVVA